MTVQHFHWKFSEYYFNRVSSQLTWIAKRYTFVYFFPLNRVKVIQFRDCSQNATDGQLYRVDRSVIRYSHTRDYVPP